MPLGSISSIISISTFLGDTTERIINATDGEVELSTAEQVEAQLRDEFAAIDESIAGVKDTLAEFELLDVALGISNNASAIYDFEVGSIDEIEPPNREGVLLLQQATAIARYVLSDGDGSVAIPSTGDDTIRDPALATSADTALTAISTVIYALASHLDNVRRFDDGAFTAGTSRDAIRDAADFLETASAGLRRSVDIDLGVIDENRAEFAQGLRRTIDGNGARETIALDIEGTTPDVADELYNTREFVEISIQRWSEPIGISGSRRTNESSAVARFDFDGDAQFFDNPIELLDDDGNIISERVDEMLEVARGLIRERAGDAFIRALGGGDGPPADLEGTFEEVEFDPIFGQADPFARLAEQMQALANGMDLRGSAVNADQSDGKDPTDSIELVENPDDTGGDKIEIITGFGVVGDGDVNGLQAGVSNDFVVSDSRSAEGAIAGSPETGAPDRILTFAGDDVIRAGRGDDVLIAGPGNDLLAGEGGNDDLRGGAGFDILRGDTLYASDNDALVGDDMLDGGAGYDVVEYEELDYAAFRNLVLNEPASGLRLPYYVPVDDPASGLDDRVTYDDDGRPDDSETPPATDAAFALVIDVPTEDADGRNLRDDLGVNPVKRDVLVDVEEITFSGGRRFIDTGSALVRIDDEVNVRLGTDVDNEIVDDSGEDVLLFGLGGRDTLVAGDGDDALWGGNGNDRLKGGDGDDFLRGGPGGDVLEGGAGDDTLVPDIGSGRDFIYGGTLQMVDPETGTVPLPAADPGTDTVLLAGHFSPDRINALFGDGSFLDIDDDNGRRSIHDVEKIGFTGAAGNTPFLTTEGLTPDDDLSEIYDFPVLLPDAAEEGLISGTPEADFVIGGSDDVSGIGTGDGDDTIYAADLLFDGRLQGTSSRKDIDAGAGDDYVAVAVNYAGTTDDAGDPIPPTTVAAGTGADMVEIGNGLVEVNGGDGGDTIRATTGTAYLRGNGEGGDDVLIGAAGFDLLEGGDGADLLIGRGTQDNLRGGPGDDTIYGDDPVDLPDGLDGLPPLGRNDGGADDIVGGAGDDAIFGGAGDDIIRGEGGDDTIEGGAGTDTAVYGGSAYDYGVGMRFADGAAPGDGGPVVVEQITLSGGAPGTLSGREGTDTLRGVETLSFPDQPARSGNLPTIKIADIDFAALDPEDADDAALLDRLAAGTASFASLPLPDDQGPILSIEAGPVEAVEGDIASINDDTLTTMTFEVTRTGDVDTFASVDWRVVPGTAQATDFRNFAIPEGDLDFSPGETSGTISFQITGGIQAEADETFEVLLEPVLGRLGNARATGIIRDDDDEQGTTDPEFDEFTDSDDLVLGTPDVDLLDAGDGDDEVFGLGGDDQLIGGPGDDTLIGDFGRRSGEGSVGNDRLEGGPGTDIAEFSGVAGDYTVEIVTPAAEGDSDPSEIVVSGPDGTDTLTGIEALRFLGDGPDSARTIDDIAALAEGPVLSIAPLRDAVTEGDTGQTEVQFEITRAGSVLAESDVFIQVSDYGDATPSDMARSSGTAVFGFGQTSALATLAVAGDLDVEGDETLTVAIVSDPSYDIDVGQAEFTIRDDDDGELIIGTPDPDTLTGTGGDDTIRGLDGDDKITGERFVNFSDLPFGNDTIEGGPGDDLLDGYFGSDTVYGGEGNDTIEAVAAPGQHDFAYGGPGDDVIRPRSDSVLAKLTAEGGAGDDTIIASSGDDMLDGGPGADEIDGKGGDDLIRGGNGDDHLTGGNGADEIRGGDGDDEINGLSGADLLFGGAGADLIRADAGDTVDAGTGGDTVLVYEPDVTVNGGAGDDDLRTVGGFASDGGGITLDGGDGDDTLRSDGDGDDRLLGGAGANRLVSFDGADFIRGGEGADTVTEFGGNDDIATFAGDDDILVFGPGNRVIDSGAGNDTIEIAGDVGDDTIIAGDGADDVEAGGGDDRVSGGAGADRLDGEAGADMLDGDGGDDRMTGGAGDDVLRGGAGDDRLLDGAGEDRLEGGAGDDILRSNDGALDDLTRATPGNDVFDGGDGQDQLHVFGPRDGFRILATDDGTILDDIDPSNGDDGRDLLVGIERIVFFEEDRIGIDQRVDLPARQPVALPLPEGQFVMAEDGFPFSTDDPTPELRGRFEIDDLLAGIVDPDGDEIELVDITGSPGLEAVLDRSSGIVRFDPGPDLNGTFTFTLTVTDIDRSGPGFRDGVFEVDVTRSLHVLSQPDAPEVEPDEFVIAEGETLAGNVFDDNGFGPDSDGDGDEFVISEIAREPFDGGTIALPSGARLTMNADGGFTYDQNGAFAELAAGESATDSFLYRVQDDTGLQSSRTGVEIRIEGAAGGAAAPRLIEATPFDDDQQGGPGDDIIEVGGATDRAAGNGGTDTFRFTFTENGAREVATFTDFDPGTGPEADVVDLNGMELLASYATGDSVTMIVDNGADLDTAIFLGVDDPARVEFA